MRERSEPVRTDLLFISGLFTGLHNPRAPYLLCNLVDLLPAHPGCNENTSA